MRTAAMTETRVARDGEDSKSSMALDSGFIELFRTL